MAQFSVPVDKSPLDVSYYPVNYPGDEIKRNQKYRLCVFYTAGLTKRKRTFGTNIVPYDKVWRLGANEATEIDFFTDVTVNGKKKIDKGRYTLYCIPQENEWTFIINRETDIWGSFKYDGSKDVVGFLYRWRKKEPIESLTITFEKRLPAPILLAGWDKKTASFPINFNKINKWNYINAGFISVDLYNSM